MGCIDKDDCNFVFNYRCLSDPDCEPLAMQYFADCSQFIDMTYNGSLTECPAACDASLKAYLNYTFGYDDDKNIDEYCNCNGQYECVTITGWYADLGCGQEPTTESPTTAAPTTAAPTTDMMMMSSTVEPGAVGTPAKASELTIKFALIVVAIIKGIAM